MAIEINTLINDFRLQITDDPEDVADRIYTDLRLARFLSNAVRHDYNQHAPQQLSLSGSGPFATLSPTPTEEQQYLMTLYWKLHMARHEKAEATRVGFSVSNVAGRVSGRERFTTNREAERDIEGEIAQELKRLGKVSALGQATFREVERTDSDTKVNPLVGPEL